MRQEWLCENCLKDGTASIPLHADAYKAMNIIANVHDRKSPQCSFDRWKVRVRNPELMTKAQWRELRKKLRLGENSQP